MAFPILQDRLPESLVRIVRALGPYSTVVTFAAGFLFDFFTMQRIDAWADLSIQLLYLTGLTALLVYQYREESGDWAPGGRFARWWAYNVEALHFLYGGLLSAYVVLYFRSSTGARPLLFFILLIAVTILNEAPRVRKTGRPLRLALYAFCVVSFMNYFVPILLGRMGGWVFALALTLSAGVVWLVSGGLAARAPDPRAQRSRLFLPGAGVCLLIALLYVLRLIPPVPLSVQFHGIYHDVRIEDGRYTLVFEEQPPWRLWRRDSRPFEFRPGDRVYYFARVFAPTRFQPRIVTIWEVQDAGGAWRLADRIALDIIGGREEGFRTFAYKSNVSPGRWRVTAATDDGRAIAKLTFRVEEGAGESERDWATTAG